MKFFDKNCVTSEAQYGFRIAKLTKIIWIRLDQSKLIAAVFLDLAKVFDTVNHRILIEKLWTRGITLNLLKSYLENRKQIVILNNEKIFTLNLN